MKKQWREQDFEIKQKIGKGTYANVYLALEKNQNKLVALKQIKKKMLINHNFQYRLRREAEILYHTNYFHITKMFGYFQSKSDVYLVMEYCPGGNLYEMLIKNP